MRIDDERIREVAQQNGAPPELVEQLVRRLEEAPEKDRPEILRELTKKLGVGVLGSRDVRARHAFGTVGHDRATFPDSLLARSGEVGDLLRPLSSRHQALVLEAMGEAIKAGLRREDSTRFVRERVAEIRGNPATDSTALAEKIEPGMLAAARDWHAPPGKPKTAANFELLAMNVSRFALLLGRLVQEHQPTGMHEEDALGAQEIVARKHPSVKRAMDASSDFFWLFPSEADEARISDFFDPWTKSSFARLEVGHKLAAALCLTDVPDDIEVRAPWPAWSLVIPDGLVPEGEALDGKLTTPARIWCVGTTPAFIVSRLGTINAYLPQAEAASDPAWRALLTLIRGACLALSSPDEFKKEAQHHGSHASKARRNGPPEIEQARFLLSAPVKVDLRDRLASVLSGAKGVSPTVQFLVRGHWKNQPHGPRNTLRKTIWVQPFWKGDEGARVLLRSHKVEES